MEALYVMKGEKSNADPPKNIDCPEINTYNRSIH